MNEETDKTPIYQPPGIPHLDPKDAKGMMKMLNKGLKAKIKMPKLRTKGIQSDQSVHVKHKKAIFY